MYKTYAYLFLLFGGAQSYELNTVDSGIRFGIQNLPMQYEK